MKTITLRRFCYAPTGTFGEIVLGSTRLFTVERPWIDNKPYVSCIPEGIYKAVYRPTTTPVPDSMGGMTWYLIGGVVGFDRGDRTRIAIHIANTVSNVEGCIGLGQHLGAIGSDWAVMSSRNAMEQFREIMPDSFTMEIVHGAAGGRVLTETGPQ